MMRRGQKIALAILGGIFLLLLPLAPSFFSVPPGKTTLLYLLGKRAGGHLEIDRLSLSWWGPQRGEGISFQSPQVEGKIDELVIDQPLAPTFKRSLTLSGGNFTLPNEEGSVEDLAVRLEKGKFEGSARLHLSSMQGKVVVSGESNLSLSLPHLSIEKGRCDLGQVLFREGQNVETLLTLLKAPSSSGRQMEIWFAPFSFEVRHGKGSIERVDLLINRKIHLCLWGNFHIAKEEIDFTIGIPSDTLQRSLGISLPENLVIPLYLKGTFREPVLDAKEAKAALAALIVSSQVGSQVGSQIGKKQPLFGKLFESAAQAAGSHAGTRAAIEAPPPKRPFPWE